MATGLAPPTRIGIDLLPRVSPHSAGVDRVARETYRALCAARPQGLEFVPMVPRARGTARWRLWDLPRGARALGLAGVHSFASGFAPLGPGWRTSTIYELPWRAGESENAGLRHRLWAHLGAHRAARLVVPSERTARHLAAECPGARDRVRVVPLGLDPGWFAPQASGQVLDRLRLEPGYLLVPGGARAKKRLDLVLEAAALLTPRPVVVASGPAGEFLVRAADRARQLGILLVPVGHLGERDWRMLVGGAGALCCLARSEGFCLPVLEGLAMGRPLVVPRDSQAEDLCAGHGSVARSHTAEEVARAIATALGTAPMARDAGREYARGFSLERTAKSLIALWRELL